MSWNEEYVPQAAEQAQTERQLRLCGVVKTLSGTKDGRLFLRWLMDECGVFRSEYPAEDRHTVWNEGRRSVGVQILELCAAVHAVDTLFEKEASHG